MVPRLNAPLKGVFSLYLGGFMNKKEKTLKKAINKNAIPLQTFVAHFYNIDDSIIANMTHEEFSIYATDNHIEVQRVPFAIIKQQALDKGIIIVVRDILKHKIPFLNPEFTKVEDYTSLLETEQKRNCDIEIDRLSYQLLGKSFDEVTDPIIKENLIRMGILIYNLDCQASSKSEEVITYDKYMYLSTTTAQLKQKQADKIRRQIEEEYDVVEPEEVGTWYKPCDCKEKTTKLLKKKRGKA
jgi:alanine racemase